MTKDNSRRHHSNSHNDKTDRQDGPDHNQAILTVFGRAIDPDERQTHYGISSLFQWDISFALDLRQGDQFFVIYEGIYTDDT